MRIRIKSIPRNAAHWHDGNSDTQYLRTEQPKVVMPSTGKAADTSWHQWWFANRQKQLQQNIETVKQNDRSNHLYNYLLKYPSAEENTKRMIQALGTTREYVGNAGMMEDSIGNALARNLLRQSIADYSPDISDNDVNSYLSYLQSGVHLPGYNSILYPGRWDAPSETTVIHERTHAANPYFQKAAINYFTTSDKVRPEDYDTWYKRIFQVLPAKYPLGIYPTSGKADGYLDSPSEVYSRLMEFRYFVGANPNYTWTKEDLKKYEPALEKFSLRRYSDDDLLKLLNEIAQNNSSFQKSDNAYLAALGGNLKSTGGPLYPFSFSKNPYWKTPIVRYDEGGEIAANNNQEFLPVRENIPVYLYSRKHGEDWKPYKVRPNINTQNIQDELDYSGKDVQLIWDNDKQTFTEYKRNTEYRAPILPYLAASTNGFDVQPIAMPQINIERPKDKLPLRKGVVSPIVRTFKTLPPGTDRVSLQAIYGLGGAGYGATMYYDPNTDMYQLHYQHEPSVIETGQGGTDIVTDSISVSKNQNVLIDLMNKYLRTYAVPDMLYLNRKSDKF